MPALNGFFLIMDLWKVRDEDARALLGGISTRTFYEWKKTSKCSLDKDVLRRISFLTDIFKALNILHSEGIADEWMQLPNKNRMFKGATPLEYLIKGDLPAFQMLRNLLNARCEGQ